MIAIIDYGMGNLASVQKAIRNLGKDVIITFDKKEIQEASLIVLPGVGSFEQGMKNLKDRGLIELLNQEVIQHKKPFLGICLGMQLIMEKGTEPIECEGLGWIKGTVEVINNSRLPVPHLGWNKTYKLGEENQEDNLSNNFYFIHSFHVLPGEHVECTYVDYEFKMIASIQKENIYATQFHPEKSQNAGLSLLKTYIESHA
tara:strand:+ start:348 stop:950 length:603 start_codon:yes stop_codon:yes gene_type:complete